MKIKPHIEDCLALTRLFPVRPVQADHALKVLLRVPELSGKVTGSAGTVEKDDLISLVIDHVSPDPNSSRSPLASSGTPGTGGSGVVGSDRK